MQKVEGSSPFSRSEESPAMDGFSDGVSGFLGHFETIGHHDWASFGTADGDPSDRDLGFGTDTCKAVEVR